MSADGAAVDKPSGPPSPGARLGEERRRRIQTWAWLAPAGASLLFLTPLPRAAASAGPLTVFAYLFGAWAIGIALAAWLAAREAKTEVAPPAEPSDPGQAEPP